MEEMDYQTARSELIAIYRLEFYKNKKNWKLCSDKKPPPPPSPKSKSAFNQTYDVQLEADLDREPPLNQAFLNEVPVDEPYPEPYHEPLLGTPTQAPDLVQAWPSQQWMEPEVGDQEEWCGGEEERAPADVAYDTCDAPYPERLWPAEQCSAAEWAGLQRLELASPAELLALAEDWLQRQGDDREQLSYCDQYSLDNDSTEFVRGAHLAPHSSETDLSVTNDECPCVSALSLRTASASRLARALQPHAAALREILLELAHRDTLRPQSPYLAPNYLLEERPTRDTDPPHAHERLLAASRQPTPTPMPTPTHMPTPTGPPSAGRGRGRGRLIGLNMGRPYRL